MADLAVIPKESAKAAAAFAEKETPRAAQAFADFVALGPSRSLRKLAALYVERKRYKTETTAFNAVAHWSGEYHWQDRIREMALSRAEEANDYRADTYVLIAGEYHRRVSDEPMRKSMQLSALHGIFDRVKPETVSDGGGGSGAHLTIQFVFQEVVRP